MLKRMTVAIALVLFAGTGLASDVRGDNRETKTDKTRTQTATKPSEKTISSTDEARAAAARSHLVAQCECPCREGQPSQPRR